MNEHSKSKETSWWSRTSHWLKTKGLIVLGSAIAVIGVAGSLYLAGYIIGTTATSIVAGMTVEGIALTTADKIAAGFLGLATGTIIGAGGYMVSLATGQNVITKAVDNMTYEEYDNFMESKSAKIVQKVARFKFGKTSGKTSPIPPVSDDDNGNLVPAS